MSESPETEQLSSHQRWYREVYLKSEHWRALRKRKFIASPLCELCGSDQHRDVHHCSYQRINRERLTDLITLCRSCHSRMHASVTLPERLAIEELIQRSARLYQRDLRNAQRPRPKGKRKQRRSEAFCAYAYHCLRAIRSGLASPQQLNFVRKNQHAISRLPV